MPRYKLAVNTAFAVKRWPLPDEWAEIIASELRVDTVQHTLDLVDLDAPAEWVEEQALHIRSATNRGGPALHSTFTGLAAYSLNLLLHPSEKARDRAENWFERAISFTALAGGGATGGHVGAFAVSSSRNRHEKEELWKGLRQALVRLTARAAKAGLHGLFIENMAVAREPSSTKDVEDLLSVEGIHVPVSLCLDVGHPVSGRSAEENDPYFWLSAFRDRATTIHLQQSDASGDRHWPFTVQRNREGRIDAPKVLTILDGTQLDEIVLVLEIIPSFEASDDSVLSDMKTSVQYWQAALESRRA
jgi:D-erythrulose 1-phosphate 3-epimerase